MNTNRPLLARLDWYWICQIAGWSTVVFFNVVAYWQYLDKPGALLTCFWGGISGFILTDLWHRLMRRMRRISAARVAASVPVLASLHVAGVAICLGIFQGPVRGLGWLPSSLLLAMGLFGAWNACYMMALAIRRAARFEAESLRLEVLAKDAELRALQAQVNPHFFFNSLNSVRALIYENPESAARMIDQLAGLMRYALQSGQADTVPLRAELEAVEAYLAIEKIRFEERLRVQIAIDATLDDVRIPPMSLQTLVENAVKYGVEMSSTGSDIRISARRAEDMVVIEIANAGAIVPFTNSTQVGLTNTRKRLALSMGREASLDLRETNGWVRATLQVPG